MLCVRTCLASGLQARTVSSIPALLAAAYRSCMQGRPGPVYVDLPSDVLAAGTKDVPPLSPVQLHGAHACTVHAG